MLSDTEGLIKWLHERTRTLETERASLNARSQHLESIVRAFIDAQTNDDLTDATTRAKRYLETGP
jgi:hypothetical protein